jgi:hypothetical protein
VKSGQKERALIINESKKIRVNDKMMRVNKKKMRVNNKRVRIINKRIVHCRKIE